MLLFTYKHMCYVEYQKAFDSVFHSWLMKSRNINNLPKDKECSAAHDKNMENKPVVE